MLATVQRAVSPGQSADTIKLTSKFQGIRTTYGRYVSLAWRGQMLEGPSGPIEIFYSSGGEVLRISNGRVIGASGFKTEWRNVDTRYPSWASIAQSEAPVNLTRMRDVMPGYRFGVKDALSIRKIDTPGSSALREVNPATLTWFEERVVSPPGKTVRRAVIGLEPADTWLPPARYAVDMEREQVVYAEVCLAADLCFTWQRWSAEMQSSLQRSKSAFLATP